MTKINENEFRKAVLDVIQIKHPEVYTAVWNAVNDYLRDGVIDEEYTDVKHLMDRSRAIINKPVKKRFT